MSQVKWHSKPLNGAIYSQFMVLSWIRSGKIDHKKHYNQAADAAAITTKSLSNIFLGHPVANHNLFVTNNVLKCVLNIML